MHYVKNTKKTTKHEENRNIHSIMRRKIKKQRQNNEIDERMSKELV